ncbi:hypothetical protein CALVIDRAFT_541606 [Calocera viscosa TUFC12733]|uniref:Cell wall mannoprotein n=1 Tax=Calocera viscosa (strain TUFC12733) TaxID=1330018 RepID=A0A167HJL3_CALVF|nr:hypothetical protein CALVIDRAFT_541606 [Calocera viscosa TUFC12733]
MQRLSALVLALLSASQLAHALPLRREVPQEHSHQPFLTSVQTSLQLNNPDGITDSVFGLLGDAAAAAGAGKITDMDCLQQATADQAFTNAKAAGDVQGQVDALIYRALERNTGAIGLASAACTSLTAVNPEIAAIAQHQDPASSNAAAVNKAIVLTLAQQIAAVGGNPLDAIKSGTFAPGTIGDPTAAGNTCDDANDANGCIFTQNLLVPDASDDEIDAAVAGISSSSGNSTTTDSSTGSTDTSSTDSDSDTATCPPPSTVTVTVTSTAAAETATGSSSAAAATSTAISTASAGTGSSTASSNGTNLQTFTGALGGILPPAVVAGGEGFITDNGSQFVNLAAALGRSCDVQHNQCADQANSQNQSPFSVGDCDTQDTECKAAGTGGSTTGTSAASSSTASTTTTQAAAVGATSGSISTVATSGTNLQTFTGALGGILPPPVVAGGEGFITDNGSQFVNLAAALGRSCDMQHNQCADLANSQHQFSVSDCDQQDTECKAA